MKFSLRKLMLCVGLLAIVIGAILAWHRWYNHEIARLELGNGYEVLLRSEYEGWRGPRRTLCVALYRNGRMFESFTCPVKSYSRMKSPSGLFYSQDKRYVYVSISNNSPRFVIGDLQEGRFTSRLSILANNRLSDASGKRTRFLQQWRDVYEEIKLHNPRMPKFLN